MSHINTREGKYRAKVTRDTETRHSANEVRETVESSTTQWEDPKRTERHGDQGPRSGSKSADQVV